MTRADNFIVPLSDELIKAPFQLKSLFIIFSLVCMQKTPIPYPLGPKEKLEWEGWFHHWRFSLLFLKVKKINTLYCQSYRNYSNFTLKKSYF